MAQHDDSLTVLLMCCHPALSPASSVALTLRAVGGLTTAEIATAYLVPESTMAQRISRAKRTLRESGATFELPATDELGDRVQRALAVVYLLYNEGYAASTGPDLTRTDRSAEAIRLGRLVHRLLPDDPEATALLALMLLLDARRPARVTASGDLVTLAEQDRSRWDHALVAEGTALLDSTIGAGRGPGEYQLQAAIAAVHDRAATAAETDWPQVLALYGLLERVAPGPFVTLARAVALAEAEGPDAAVPVLDSLDAALGDHQRLHAVRGHVAELRGDRAAARGTTSLPRPGRRTWPSSATSPVGLLPWRLLRQATPRRARRGQSRGFERSGCWTEVPVRGGVCRWSPVELSTRGRGMRCSSRPRRREAIRRDAG